MSETGNRGSEGRGSDKARGRSRANGRRHANVPVDVTPKQKQLQDAWVDFGRRLVATLSALEEDEFLVIGIKRSNRFVQFAAQGAHGLRVEAVSNFYLPEGQRLGEAQHATLLELGWNAPSNLPDEFGHEPVGSPDYHLDLPPPLDLDRIAALAINTLCGPLDADTPLDLEYQSFAESGESIRWPTLGLRRAQS